MPLERRWSYLTSGAISWKAHQRANGVLRPAAASQRKYANPAALTEDTSPRTRRGIEKNRFKFLQQDGAVPQARGEPEDSRCESRSVNGLRDALDWRVFVRRPTPLRRTRTWHGQGELRISGGRRYPHGVDGDDRSFDGKHDQPRSLFFARADRHSKAICKQFAREQVWSGWPGSFVLLVLTRRSSAIRGIEYQTLRV